MSVLDLTTGFGDETFGAGVLTEAGDMTTDFGSLLRLATGFGEEHFGEGVLSETGV